MISSNMEHAIDLVMDQYEEMTNHYDKWETAFLEDEAEKGVDEFGAACRVVFGTHLSEVLYRAITNAEELNRHAHSLICSTSRQDGESKSAAILLACELAAASKILHGVQRSQECGHIEESLKLSQSAEYYANEIVKQLDPEGILLSDDEQ